ncbi:MAG: hypothetical protein ABR616_01760 [Dermatophilaceae bacterium]
MGRPSRATTTPSAALAVLEDARSAAGVHRAAGISGRRWGKLASPRWLTYGVDPAGEVVLNMEPTFLSEWGMVVAVALWASAGLGLLAVIAAVVRPSQRRMLLVVAALLFLPIGFFGILSVGAAFLLAAVVCLGFAAFGGRSETANPA